MNANDLEDRIAELEAEGCVPGEYFVATSSVDGVIDPMPEFRNQCLANLPSSTAKAIPPKPLTRSGCCPKKLPT